MLCKTLFRMKEGIINPAAIAVRYVPRIRISTTFRRVDRQTIAVVSLRAQLVETCCAEKASLQARNASERTGRIINQFARSGGNFYIPKRGREKARRAGKVYIDPETLKHWYKRNSAAVEYAAFHVLKLFKGTTHSLQPTHAVLSMVTLDASNPNNPAVTKLREVVPMQRAIVSEKMLCASPASLAHCERAVREGTMILVFSDLDNKLIHMELPTPPSSEPYTSGWKQPDAMWKVHALFKINTQEGSQSTPSVSMIA